MANIRKNHVGLRSGRRVIIGYSHHRGSTSYWISMCDCGVRSVTKLQSFNNSVSCGCYQREIAVDLGKKRSTHGDRKSKEYTSWLKAKERCFDKNNNRYYSHGGRGISVCDRWRYSYENFISDMGRAPSPKHSLDRINNDGNYEPSNCRWATPKEQANNRRSNRVFVINGEAINLSQASSKYGLHRDTISKRLSKGWTIEKACLK